MKLSISTTRRETLLGIGYILFSQLVLPLVLDLVNALLKHPWSVTVLNLVYFAVNFAAVIGVFHRFLWASLKAFARTPWRCLRYAVLGIGPYYLASMLINFVISLIDPDFSNVNDQFITDLTREHYSLMFLFTVFFGPITEETLYRGVLFQGLQRKNRLLAYGVSAFIFAGIHVANYVGFYDWLTLGLCFLQYLPASIIFAVVYEETDTIATPILMHIILNLIAMSSLR